MNLFLLRHTKVGVPPGICYGQANVSLAASFHNDKYEVQRELEGMQFDAIFSSPLMRCRALAEFIAHDNTIDYDSRLMELNFGMWERKDWNEISKTCHAQRWFDEYLDMECPGGESYAQLLARVASFLNNLNEKPFGNVLIVTHGGVIRSINCILNKITPHKAFELNVDYGSILKLEMSTSVQIEI